MRCVVLLPKVCLNRTKFASPASGTSWIPSRRLLKARGTPHSVFSPERQPWTSQGDISTKRSLQRPHCQPRWENSWQIKQLRQIPFAGATQGRHCSSENIVRLTHWRMWMWRYLPKRLELLLRIVLAFPKLSRMGKTSMGWLRRRRTEMKSRPKWREDWKFHLPALCFVPNWSNCTSVKVFPCAFSELPVAGCRFCPDTWSWGSGLSAW